MSGGSKGADGMVDDHARGTLHDHHHHHHHGGHTPERRSRAGVPRFSLLRTSLGARLIGAVGLSALIWLGVLWALK